MNSIVNSTNRNTKETKINEFNNKYNSIKRIIATTTAATTTPKQPHNHRNDNRTPMIE